MIGEISDAQGKGDGSKTHRRGDQEHSHFFGMDGFAGRGNGGLRMWLRDRSKIFVGDPFEDEDG
jgi:hypothetical protein